MILASAALLLTTIAPQDAPQEPVVGPLPEATASTELGEIEAVDASREESDGQGPDLREEITVNGEKISHIALKRFLCYGAGRNLLEAAKLDLLVDQERQIRANQGEDIGKFSVTQEEYDAAFGREVSRFLERFPGLDLPTEISRAYKSPLWYERSLMQTLRFDKMFFGGHPNNWPEVTKEAVYAGSPQVDLVKDAAENHDRRVQWAEENGTEVVPEDDMFMGLLRDYVIESLRSLVIIETQTNGIPEDQLVTVEGGGFDAALETSEFYDGMADSVLQAEADEGRRFLTLCKAAEQRLAKEGFWMSDEEYGELISSMMGDLEASVFSLEFLAVHGHRYPSTEAYNRILRLTESLKQRHAADITPAADGALPAALGDHLTIANRVMGLSRADAEILLVAAFDFPTYSWKPDGWDWALNRSLEIKAEIDAYIAGLDQFEADRLAAVEAGRNHDAEQPLPFDRWWANLLDLNSEFWDPPMPASGKMPPMVGMKSKGRFGLKTRNDLERDIGESPYTHFLDGGSITDAIFFDMEPGEVSGPYKGPHGYYIVYLKSRTAPTNPLNVRDAKHLELLQQDFLRRKLVEFAHESARESEIVGITIE